MKRTDFNPTATWESEKGDPGTHLVMAVFGCVIYELNKCADAFSEANVIACAKMSKICSSYAEKKDDFRSSLQAIIYSFFAKLGSNRYLLLEFLIFDDYINRQILSLT